MCGEQTETMTKEITRRGSFTIQNDSVVWWHSGWRVVCEPVTAHSSLEKIGPLKIKINFTDMFCNDDIIALKLNEVIEKVNLIIEVIGRVK